MMDKRILLLFVILILFAAPVEAAIKACTACNSTCNTLPGMNGTNGTNGTSATITVNYTGTLPAGSSADVDNIGGSLNAVFDFFIPKGDTGAKGDTGSTGAPGSAATVAANYTFTLAPGNPASVTNVGTASAALFDFSIPRGYNGTDGSAGDTTQFLFLNGTRGMSGFLRMSGFNISNLLDPVYAQDAATKNYVDAVNTSMRNNVSIYSASTAYVDAVNTSMRINVSANFPSTSYVIAVNDSMRNNISVNHPTFTQLNAVNDSMRNNVSQYVVAVNNSQTANTSAYVIAVNNSMKAYVDAKPAGGDTSQFLFLNGSRPMTGGLQMGGFNISNLLDPVAAQQAATKAYADLLNATMASNISVNHPTITFLNTVNDTMRNNVSQYVIAVNNSQNINISLINSTQNVNVSLVNTSMRNNVSAYVIAVNDSMRANVSQYVIAVNTSMNNNLSVGYAPLVGGKVPTANLGGAGADSTKFLRGDQSWQLPGAGAGDGNTYYLQGLSYSPADNVANYFGANPVAGQTTVNQTPVWFYKAGTITGVTVTSYAGTAGTAETWGMYLLINGSTEYPLQNITVAGNTRVWRNSTISVAVVNGSHMQIKTRNPAWVTNPLTCTYGAYVTVT